MRKTASSSRARTSKSPKKTTVQKLTKSGAKSSAGKSQTPKTRELKVGQAAPAFTLKDDTGKKISLSQFKGKNVVLYFYPKDDTPGCTKEACAFRDGIDEIRESGAVVLGVSADSVESHKRFSDKFDLNFPLLSDVDKKMLQAYGVWKEKSLYGRKFMGIERTTFIIDQKGKIATIFPKVKVDTHFDDVVSKLEMLS